MKLEQLLTPEDYLHLERYVNQPKYSVHAQYSDAEQQYHPRLGTGSFPVPFYWRKDATLLTAFPDEQLLNLTVNNGFRVFVHPQFAQDNAQGFVNASPTASTRTLFVFDNVPYFVKLHFPKRISRFNRRLKPDSVEHSVKISADLERSLATAPASFAYLPESIGVYVPEEFGCIVREAVARPKINDRTYIPFFSLYSKDPHNPEDKPLLIQLIENSKSDPLPYFSNHIVSPFIANWLWFARERGILLESHCQNTLLEIGDNQAQRIVYRDFQSIMVDAETRKAKGLAVPFTKHVIGGVSDPFPKEQEYSIVYDHFVAAYVFPYFTKCLEEYCGVPEKTAQEEIKRVFRSLCPNQESLFPRTEFTLTDKLFDDNRVELEDTHVEPKFR